MYFSNKIKYLSNKTWYNAPYSIRGGSQWTTIGQADDSILGRRNQRAAALCFLSLFKSTVLALVAGLYIGAFQIGGVISMGLAHILMFLAWFISVIYLYFVVEHKLIAFVVLSVFFLLSALWMVKKRAELDMANVPSSSADVGLCLVYPQAPALQIVNLSNVVAREMKYVVVLWNLNLPERIDPLPIPAATFDWLKPHLRSSPRNLFSTPAVESLLHPGDRLVGSMSVNCPNCIRGHLYVVSIVWERGGWFAEIPDAKEGSYFFPKFPTKERMVAFAEELFSSVSEQSRVPIEAMECCP